MLVNIEEMKNISVLIEGAATKRFRPKKPFATYGTRLAAKEATVFWNFKNITSTIGNNTYGIKGSADKTIKRGIMIFRVLKLDWKKTSLNFRSIRMIIRAL